MSVDIVIEVDNKPGQLALVAAAVSDAGVNLAAATCIGNGEKAELHIVVPHAEPVRHALASRCALMRDGKRGCTMVDAELGKQ